MPLDPAFRALLDLLESAGALTPFDDVAEARVRFRTFAMARRNAPDYVSEPVASVEDVSIDTAAGSAPARVYTPVTDRGRVVSYFHGGGFVVGDLDTHDTQCRRIANALGAVVVSFDYRLAPEHPYPFPAQDAAAGVGWTTNAYPDRTHVVAGDSAGANLAVEAALRLRGAGPRPIAALLLLYPPTDPTLSMPSVTENGEGYFLTKRDMAWFTGHYKPELPGLLGADLTGLPPAVVATAEFDPLRDEGDAFAERLAQAGVAVRHIQAAGLIHGFFGFAGVVDAATRAADEVLAAVEELLAS